MAVQTLKPLVTQKADCLPESGHFSGVVRGVVWGVVWVWSGNGLWVVWGGGSGSGLGVVWSKNNVLQFYGKLVFLYIELYGKWKYLETTTRPPPHGLGWSGVCCAELRDGTARSRGPIRVQENAEEVPESNTNVLFSEEKRYTPAQDQVIPSPRANPGFRGASQLSFLPCIPLPVLPFPFPFITIILSSCS